MRPAAPPARRAGRSGSAPSCAPCRGPHRPTGSGRAPRSECLAGRRRRPRRRPLLARARRLRTGTGRVGPRRPGSPRRLAAAARLAARSGPESPHSPLSATNARWSRCSGFTVSLGGLNQAALFFGIMLDLADRRDDPGLDHADQRHPPAAAQRLTAWAAGMSGSRWRTVVGSDRPRSAAGTDAARRQPHDPAPRSGSVGAAGPRRPRVLATSGCAGSPAGRPSPARTRPDEPPRPPTPSPRGVGSGSSPGPTDVPAGPTRSPHSWWRRSSPPGRCCES